MASKITDKRHARQNEKVLAYCSGMDQNDRNRMSPLRGKRAGSNPTMSTLPDTKRLLSWLGAGIIVATILTCCGGFAVLTRLIAHDNSETGQTKKTIAREQDGLPTVDDLERQLAGLTMQEIRQRFGNPDQVVQDAQVNRITQNEDCWAYRRKTRDALTGKADSLTCIWFRSGRVIHVSSFNTPNP